MDMAKPIIRFKGYQDDWEQRKLGDVVDSVDTGKSRFDKEGSSGEYPILGSTSVIGYDDEYDYEGDFILTARVGANAGSLYRHAGKVKISDNTVFIQASQNIEFLYQLLIQFDIKKLSFGTGQPLVKASELKSLELMMPTDMKEQMRIGVYFKNLDTLITLHQRKCDETKKLKKYMLQKMFPQNGEKVPEIRFSGFTDDWEQRKLSEIALQTYGGGTPKTANEEFWKGNIPWIQSSDLIEERLFNVKPRKYISQEAISKSATKLVPQNSVAIVTRVGVGKLAFMPFSYATSQDFLSLSELKIEPEFAVYALYKMMRLVSNEVQGTSIKGITKDELLAKEILIPDCEEQKKIGAYLHNLDHLITLHQRELENLQNIKKFMLGKMFV